jgi:hypothetical protein
MTTEPGGLTDMGLPPSRLSAPGLLGGPEWASRSRSPSTQAEPSRRDVASGLASASGAERGWLRQQMGAVGAGEVLPGAPRRAALAASHRRERRDRSTDRGRSLYPFFGLLLSPVIAAAAMSLNSDRSLAIRSACGAQTFETRAAMFEFPDPLDTVRGTR